MVMKPAGVAGTVDISNTHTLSPSYVNSFRISAVTSRLLVHLRADAITDNTEFYNLCLSLARGIDYAVANNEIPGRAPDLPNLLKQVCQRKKDSQLQAAVMVLMISVKSACSNGWFGEKEKEELHLLYDEMQSSFCSVSVKDLNSKMKNTGNNHQATISTIMSRFYPGMKLGEILCSVEAMPGYDSYVTDLHISKSARSSPNDKIYLFVAQTDNIETSSCIISPQQVNFLLNGEGVDRRTCVYKDPGPQMPTSVTHMLKYGSNLLQVVGQFTGKYLIMIAFMSMISNPSSPSIPDYIPPAAALPDSDSDIIEGPSRISLKCPISFSRIKIPVKGHTCKHLQCFDFNNYVGINSRRPLWRCPHCSQSVCFHDIRIDQSMVKVLKEVGEDVTYIKISSNGSWEAIAENNENTEKPTEAPPQHQEATIIQNIDDVMDLTEGDNNTNTEADKDYDEKPSVVNSTPSSNNNNNNNNNNRNLAPHMEDAFWREYYSGSASRTATTNNNRLDVADVAPTTRERDTATAIIPSLNREIEDFRSNNLIFNSLTQSQSQSQSQSLYHGYHPRYPAQTYNVTRTPSAVQALPAQTPGESQSQQNALRSHLSHHQNMARVTSLNNGQNQSQGQSQQDAWRSHLTYHQKMARWTPPNNGLNQSLGQSQRDTNSLAARHFNSHDLQKLSQRHPVPMRPATQVGPNSMSSSQAQYSLAAIQRATAQVRTDAPSIPIPPPPVAASTSAAAGSTVDATTGDPNWIPAGRMRGSLSGRAYTEALNQYLIHPNQPVQAARPPPVLNTPRPFIPPHLQVLMANNNNNNLRAQGGGNGADSDTSVGGGGDGVVQDK